MSATSTPNADLEQALFKASLKEKRLRRRAMLAAIVPALAGAVWLGYSLLEVTTLQSEARETAEREAGMQQRENEAQQRIADADAKRVAAEAGAQAAQEREKAASASAEDALKRLVKVRDEIGGLGALLADLNSARAKASRLNSSEAVEAQIVEIRATLGRTLAHAEQEIDKALPLAERKPRVFIYTSDDSQSAAAKALASALEEAGFDVAPVVKNPGPRIDSTEIRYFHEPQDKADAAKIQELVAKQTGQTDCKLARTNDPDSAGGSRKFQVWLGKPAAH